MKRRKDNTDDKKRQRQHKRSSTKYGQATHIVKRQHVKA